MGKRSGRVLAALLGLLACIGALTACRAEPAAPESADVPAATAEPAAEAEGTLVVAQSPFGGQFSPYAPGTAADASATDLTQIRMLTVDRSGGVVRHAIEGETVPFRGTPYFYRGPCDVDAQYDAAADATTYTIRLAEGLVFSDGEPVDADDLVFTYYVFADPAYAGPDSLKDSGILGLRSYQTQIPEELETAYAALATAIRAAGAGHVWKAADGWTQEQQSAYWRLEKAAWMGDLQDIVDSAKTNYASFLTDIGKTEADLAASDRLDVALGMYAWSFALPDGAGGLVGVRTGASWDLTTTVPSMEDFYAEATAVYSGDPEAFFAVEAVDSRAVSTLEQARADFVREQAQADPAAAGGVPNIAGIQKIDPRTVAVQTKGYDASAVYAICDLPITPLHYYGDAAQYSYENNRFGHPFGDLSAVLAKADQPLGAGPYRFVTFEDSTCFFEANEHYYKGEPKTKFVRYRETSEEERIAALAAGSIDAATIAGSKEAFEAIAAQNANGSLSGETIATAKVNSPVLGFIGLNARNIQVGGDSASPQSRALRTAIATVLAADRGAACERSFGEAALILEYPLSADAWAAPLPRDEGTRTAFSLDVNGETIYRADMTQEQRYAAALQAAVGYFQAAGFRFDETSGQITKVPEGAKQSYDAVYFDDGTGNTPLLPLLQDASATLAKIGFSLNVRQLPKADSLAFMRSAGTQEIWCFEREAAAEPNLYPYYNSSAIVGRGGTDANDVALSDAALDQLLLDAGKPGELSVRKAAYQAILDRIADWAVEVPVYQRQSAFVFSAERVNLETVAPDGTAFWNWQNAIELVEMK